MSAMLWTSSESSVYAKAFPLAETKGKNKARDAVFLLLGVLARRMRMVGWTLEADSDMVSA